MESAFASMAERPSSIRTRHAEPTSALWTSTMGENDPWDEARGQPASLPRSLWAQISPPAPATTRAVTDARVDVAIIGAGYTGLSAAIHLAQAGAKVAVIEAAESGWGASGRNGGQVIPGLKIDPEDVLRVLGQERGKRLVEWA